MATLEMPIVDEPLFVSVTLWVVPLRVTAILPKLMLVGLTAAVPALELTPTPESERPCGLLLALSLKLNVAVRVPVAEGLNTTPTLQAVEGARVEPQAEDALENSLASVPVGAMLLMFRVDELPFIR
jgi:hypothetical protein